MLLLRMLLLHWLLLL
jgi:hypothetical protein